MNYILSSRRGEARRARKVKCNRGEAPCPLIAATDAACESDRLWFDNNPGRRFRLRPLVPNEIPGLNVLGDTRVCVWRVRAGLRARLPFHANGVLSNTDATGAEIVRELVGGQRRLPVGGRLH
jgi:hypothetical protein